jgi:hypothetical protein
MKDGDKLLRPIMLLKMVKIMPKKRLLKMI